MTKTARILADSIKLVDIIIEVLDARIPYSSGNPDFDKLFLGKKRLMLLNKEDLADPEVSLLWREYFAQSGIKAIFTDLKTGNGIKAVKNELRKIGEEKSAKKASKGVVHRPVRVLVAGIPNSGKSTLINKLAGRASAKTADKPGVTKAKQWIKIDNGVDLLDTPGILWPKFENREVALNLAYTGAIKDAVTDIEEISEALLRRILECYPECLAARYKISVSELSHNSILGIVAKKRGFLLAGGEVDLHRAASIVLDEFRAARIGRISLERPQEKS